MRIVLIAASSRQPKWVEDGFTEYARRLRGGCSLELKAVPLARRSASTGVERAVEIEGERVLAAVPTGARVVELSERGVPWRTVELASQLERWLAGGAPVGLLVGGPDGLSARCSERAEARWSLSPLTLPHGLVRVIAAEALYRAWSLLMGHPYHRG